MKIGKRAKEGVGTFGTSGFRFLTKEQLLEKQNKLSRRLRGKTKTLDLSYTGNPQILQIRQKAKIPRTWAL